MRRTTATMLGLMIVFVSTSCGGSKSASATTTATTSRTEAATGSTEVGPPVSLGAAKNSGIEGLPVPAVATLDKSPNTGTTLFAGDNKIYLFPGAVTFAALSDWFASQVPMNEAWRDWQWCDSSDLGLGADTVLWSWQSLRSIGH